MVVASPEDLVNAVARDRRMSGYRVRRQGDGWLELEVVNHRPAQQICVVLAWPGVWQDPAQLAPHLIRARSGNYPLLVLGSDDELSATPLDLHDADLTAVASPVGLPRLLHQLRARAEAIAQRLHAAQLELDLDRSRNENEMLVKIGRSLSQERETSALLSTILGQACEVTNADAGSIYIVDGGDLRFVASKNDSRAVSSSGFTMPVSEASIVGRCVLEREPINIPDLYAADCKFAHDRSFDDKHGYESRSMLVVPMISARGEVIGVIQLINRRAKGFITLEGPTDFDRGVVAFEDNSLVNSLASQAGIALENIGLYQEVTRLFDGFVNASVSAIEQRDPTTSGHSQRVADLTVDLAKAVDKNADLYRDLRYTESDLTQIKYAGLLHDFGKVGVREHILVKAKKLYEHERALILQRFQLIKRGYRIEGLESKVRYLLESSRDQLADQLAAVDRDVVARVTQLDDMIQFILSSNEPTVLDQGGFERIAEIAGMSYRDETDEVGPFLTPSEASSLQIRRGSLTEAERLEINDHVVHSFKFLQKIPWSRALRDVPMIAAAHHEKLDGSGYPHKLRGDDIPMPSRMMAITDIFDALTAKDRPYKRAMPADKALDILAADVKRGQLDSGLFDVFVGAGVWRLTSPHG